MPQDTFQANFCADQLKALGDPLRLRLIDALRSGEMTVGDLAILAETDIALVSHHLQVLKHSQLVETRREGRYIYYRLRDDLVACRRGANQQFLDLGCCRIEIPATR